MDDTKKIIERKIGRRGFLGGVLAVGGAAAGLGLGGFGALTRLARGQEGTPPPERFYVFAYFQGGWDTLLGIDPRDPAVFSEETVGLTRIQPGYGNQSIVEYQSAPARAPGTDILLGPAARPLDAVADRLTLVRGMSMDTLTHEVGRRRFITGKPPSGLNARGSAGSAWLASRWGGRRLIPNLSVQVESFNPELPPDYSALRVGSSTDLVAMLRRAGGEYDEAVDLAIHGHLSEDATCARSLGSPMLRSAEAARLRMRSVLEADVQALFDFSGTDEGIQALRDRYGFAQNQLTSPGAQAAVAYQALTNGVSRVVSFAATSNLDTHFDDWEDDQAPRQREGFGAVATLAQHLAETEYADGESMLDRTYIVCFSEFMRTPLLNARGGRDHWLANSCAIVGGKSRPGGRVIGASSDVGMAPQLVDLTTGAVTEDAVRGQIVRPEHVLRTLLVDAGLEEDRADLRVPPIPGLLST